jgi:hypothetical protein
MSIQTFKKKYANISGKGPPTFWVNKNSTPFSPTGFSINGGLRTGTYIGKTSVFSKVVTPYLGKYPKNLSKKNGEIIYAAPAQVRCIQTYFCKPSVLNVNKKKYLCCHDIVSTTGQMRPYRRNIELYVNEAGAVLSSGQYQTETFSCLNKFAPHTNNTFSGPISSCKKCTRGII